MYSNKEAYLSKEGYNEALILSIVVSNISPIKDSLMPYNRMAVLL